MKKVKNSGLNGTFVLFLSCILAVFFSACEDRSRETDVIEQENAEFDFSHHECLITVSKKGFHANCANKNFTSERFIAYSGSSESSSKEHIVKLKSPFPTDEHPPSLLDMPFFEAHSENGNVYIHYVYDILPFWDFSKMEDRSLDYTIYHQILNHHEELRFNQKVMRVDFLYFTPYYENESSIYVLSWNPAEDVSEHVEIKDDVVLFPVKKEKNKKIGVIISPQVNVQRNKTSIDMSANFHISQFKFRINFETVDKNGKCWVLSWRKINKSPSNMLTPKNGLIIES